MRHDHRSTSAAVAAALAASLLTGCAARSTGPDVPAQLAVPSGNKLAFTYQGSGLLNYECRARADTPGSFDWALVSPDAALKDRDVLVGKYYGGPTWEHADGSKVTGKQVAVSPAPTPGDIPWQLVQAAPSPGSLTMNGVTYVQRINTKAGLAPSDACTAGNVAAKRQVRYSADYLFYKG